MLQFRITETHLDKYFIIYVFFEENFFPPIFGKKPVINPIRGRKAQTLYTKNMLVWSAKIPNTAEPRPPMPKANPKNNPETIPTLPGINSCA